MNSICLMGRIANDLELKTTANGVPVMSFSVAVDRPYRNKDQERQTDFIPCVAWRQTAEFISRFFHKGNRIAIQGTLQSRNYETKDGAKRTAYDVVIENAFFCESKSNSYGTAPAAPGYDSQIPQPVEAKPAFSSGNTGDFEEILSDEELPF